MKKEMTQKEMVARYLAARMGQWVPGWVLVSKTSSVVGKDYIIQDADTRAYDIVEEGFTSPNAKYTFEHRKKGKYAEFRCAKKETIESIRVINAAALKWFDALPA